MKLTRRRLFGGLALLTALGGGGAAARAATNRYYDGPVSDHWDGTHFFDENGSPPKKLNEVARWWATADKVAWPQWRPSPHEDRPPARVTGRELRISYVGHASLLLQTAGLNILLDPVWSERASPFSFLGPKRVNAPGVAFENLPKIDAVLVSHGHYDHLDVHTLSRLAKAHDPHVITPLGNDTIMKSFDETIRAERHDWNDRVVLSPEVAVTLAPMRHWTARGVFDRNKALWAAFIIETPAGKIYHIGDTGYGDGVHFRNARAQHGPFKLAIIPIGAYEPRWFMQDQHVNPEEAVRVFADCGAERALAHHHGTFQLTDEDIDAPAQALAAARSAAGIAPERFAVLAPGQVLTL